MNWARHAIDRIIPSRSVALAGGSPFGSISLAEEVVVAQPVKVGNALIEAARTAGEYNPPSVAALIERTRAGFAAARKLGTDSFRPAASPRLPVIRIDAWSPR